MRFNDRGLRRGFGLVTGLALLVMAVPAGAQENLDQGKSAQQLFASDCAICHKSPQGLAKAGGVFGLQGFLREHYTASRETAVLLSKYLESVGGEAPAAESDKRGRRTAKPAGSKPAGEAKSAEKPGESKPESKAETKPETKPEAAPETKSESKSEAKAEPKPEAKPEPKAEVQSDSKPEPKAETAAKPAAEKSDKAE